MRCLAVLLTLFAAVPGARAALKAGEPVAASALHDVGDETALAALETYLHAANAGKATELVAMLRWTWRANAHRAFSDIPEPWSEKAGSPEKLIALAEAIAFSRVERVQLCGHVVVSDAEEIYGVRALTADGRSAEHLFWMRWSGGRWLRVMPSTAVARLARMIADGRPPDTTETSPFREQYAWIVPQTGPKPALPPP